jgi:hypothetical protein
VHTGIKLWYPNVCNSMLRTPEILVRILLFSSLTFKMTTKMNSFYNLFCLLLFECRFTSFESFPLYLFPKLWVNFPNENIKFIRNVYEFNLSLKEHFIENLSLNVVPYVKKLIVQCPSCNPYLQIRI